MKKGIAMVSLIVTISVMLILISTLTIAGVNTSNTAKKISFASELKMLQESVDSYRVNNNGEFPVSDFVTLDLSSASEGVLKQFLDNNESINSENKISFSKIDYNKIQISSITRGNSSDNNDVYVVSNKTGIVYYAKGLKIGNNTYYTLTEELKKLLEYNKKNDEVNSDNPVVFVPDTTEWTNESFNFEVKVPKIYSNITVKVEDNEVFKDDAKDDNFYLYNFTVDNNSVITVKYFDKNNNEKNVSYNIMNIDKVSPEINIKNITNSSKTYIELDINELSSGVKYFKYDIGKISNNEIGKTYFNSNGKEIKNNMIEVDKEIPYITVYAEDNAGNYSIQNLEVGEKTSVLELYEKNNLVLFYDGIQNTRNGHSDTTTVWEDLSGKNNDANLTNITPSSNNMIFNNTSANDGGVSGVINFTKNFTFEVLFKTTKSPSFILDARVNEAGYQPLYSYAGNSIQTYSSFGSDISANTLSKSITDDNIHSISIVFNDTNTLIYLDGKLELNLAKNGGIYASKLFLGMRHRSNSTNSNFKGNMYTVRCYNKALNAEEVQKNYKSDKSRYNF